MTISDQARQAAEKILNQTCDIPAGQLSLLHGLIASEIERVVGEVLDEDHRHALDVSGFVEKAKAQGRNEGLEEAARAAESYPPDLTGLDAGYCDENSNHELCYDCTRNSRKEIGKQIRALKSEKREG